MDDVFGCGWSWSHLSEEEYLEIRLREAGVSDEIIAALKTELFRNKEVKGNVHGYAS
ncbi:hypothetical protein GCM10025857_06220 [Alicyclobacillus contaminans]|nr:hypothetical protein GCM10025857_06220 [Alicyclobacillus contaminans]